MTENKIECLLVGSRPDVYGAVFQDGVAAFEKEYFLNMLDSIGAKYEFVENFKPGDLREIDEKEEEDD